MAILHTYLHVETNGRLHTKLILKGIRLDVDMSLPKRSVSTNEGDLVRGRRRPPKGLWQVNGIGSIV